MFLSLVLTVLCLYLSAQSRIEVIGRDTMAVVPVQQLRTANAKFVELKQCKEENDSLFSQIREYTGMTNNLRSSVTNLKHAHDLNMAIIADQKKIIDIADQQLKKSTRKQKILKIERNSLAGILVITIAKFLLF